MDLIDRVLETEQRGCSSVAALQSMGGRGVVEETETVVQRLRGRTDAMPIAPFTLPFADPLKARKDVKRQREAALHEAELFINKITRPTKKQIR